MKIPDITPLHHPKKLYEDFRDNIKNENIVAGFYVLLNDKDELIYDGCGMSRKDLLWALEQTKRDVLGD